MAINQDYPEDQVRFPDGYEHFADLATAAATRLRALDDRIKAIPLDDIKKVHQHYRHDPPGLYQFVNRWQKRDDRDALEAQKIEIEETLHKKIDRDIESWGIDVETAVQIRGATIDTIHPNPFAGISGKELEKEGDSRKEQNYSQNYMRSLLRDSRSTSKEEQSIITKPLQQEKQELDPSKLSFSQRYTLNLSFGSPRENPSAKPKSRDIDKE